MSDDDTITDSDEAEDSTNEDSEFVKLRRHAKNQQKLIDEQAAALRAYRKAETEHLFANLLGLAPGQAITGPNRFMVDAYDGEPTTEAISQFMLDHGVAPATKELQDTIAAQQTIDTATSLSIEQPPGQPTWEEREKAARESGDIEAEIALQFEKLSKKG